MKRVEYNLNNSDYSLVVNGFKFIFSSEFNKMRYELNYSDFIEEETAKLKARYNVNINLEKYLLVVFYKKIEKRGFRVLTYKNDDIIELSNDYIFKIE